MKVVAVSILILLMATQAFSKWVILLEFNRNRDYIAQNLCENRTKPQVKCGGKCQLTKALEKDEKGSSSSQTAKSGFVEILFFQAGSDEQGPLPITSLSGQWPPFQMQLAVLPPHAIFHPPASVNDSIFS
jgi:hypothetical protein